jgi:hypothetical protein
VRGGRRLRQARTVSRAQAWVRQVRYFPGSRMAGHGWWAATVVGYGGLRSAGLLGMSGCSQWAVGPST